MKLAEESSDGQNTESQIDKQFSAEFWLINLFEFACNCHELISSFFYDEVVFLTAFTATSVP